MTDLATIRRVLHAPRAYADPDLDAKWERAVEYLRTKTQLGWVCDHPIVRVWGTSRRQDDTTDTTT